MTPKVMRRTYLREALLMLLAARLAVRVLPASRLLAWANRPLRRRRRFAADAAPWVGWSVETMGAKPWIDALCLPRALAAQAMLRRRGIASRLCLGVACEGLDLAAHAWIEVGEDVVVGGAERAKFSRLAEFGGGALQH
jgi:transglutaminase superfamily protein